MKTNGFNFNSANQTEEANYYIMNNKIFDKNGFPEEIFSLLISSGDFFTFIRYLEPEKQDEFSESVLQITGYSQKEINSLKNKYLSCIHEDDLRKFKDKLLDLEERLTENTYSIEYRLNSKSGDIVRVKEFAKVVRDSSGSIKHVVGFINDITESKKKIDEMQILLHKMEKLNHSKDKLISIVSHDLRAPFTSLLGFSEILLNEPDLQEAERREYLEYINDASRTQLQLINYLLDWSRLQTGTMKVEPRRLETKSIINNCVSVLTGAAIRKNIEIKTDIPKNMFLNVDERLINQAITNLLSNAIKFTQPGKNILIKSAKFKEQTIEIIIKDEGVGISEENQSKLFRIDEKFTLNGTMGEKGSGLGLTLVKEIVEKHNGQIWFYSKENEGTEFHITLPEAHNIFMIIENNQNNKQLYESVIQDSFSNFDIVFAQNGYEAINLIAEKTPALIISHHHMPLMTGTQLVESLKKKENYKNIPIAISAENLEDSVKNRYIGLGVREFLYRPLNYSTVENIIKDIIN